MIIVIIGLAAVTYIIVMPWANERLAEWGSKKLTEVLGTRASFESVGVTRGGTIVVRDLMVHDPLTPDETFFYSPRVEVTIDPLNLLKEGINLRRVYIRRPMVSIYRRADGKWNVQAFGKKEDKESKGEKKKSRFRLRIDEVVLEGCVTKLRGVLGEEIVTVLDHRGSLDVTAKRQEITLKETHFNSTYLTLTDMTASGRLVVEDKVLGFESFRLLRDANDMTLEGKIDFKGDDKVDIKIARSHFDLGHLPPRYGLRHRVAGQVDFEMTLKGYIKSPLIQGRIYRADGEAFDYRFSETSCLFHMADGEIDITGLSSSFLKGSIGGDVSFFLRESPRAFRVDLKVSGIDIRSLPMNIPEKYGSILNGQVIAYGAGFHRRDHSSTILLDLESCRLKGIPIGIVQAQVLAQQDGFHLLSSRIGLQGGRMELTGDLGWSDLDVTARVDSVPVSPLLVLLGLPYDLRGRLNASVSLGGSYTGPSVQGQVIIRNGGGYGWSFAGVESKMDIHKFKDGIGGDIGLHAFMVGRERTVAEEIEAEAQIKPGAIRLDSLMVKRKESEVLRGSGEITFSGDSLQISGHDLVVTYHGLDASVKDLETGVEWRKRRVDIKRLGLAIGGGEVSLEGGATWPDQINLEAEAHSVDLDSLEAHSKMNLGIEGDLDMRVLVGGTFHDPEISLTTRIDAPSIKGVRSDSLVLAVKYGDYRLDIERFVIKGGGYDCDVRGVFPLLLDLQPFRVAELADAPIDLEAGIAHFDLSSLKLLTGEINFVDGYMEGKVRLGGTPARTTWNGRGGVHGGEGVIMRSNTYFSGLQAEFAFHEEELTISSLAAALMGGGSLRGSGNIQMDGFVPSKIDLDIAMKNYTVNQVQYVSSLSLDSNLHVSGDLYKPDVSGNVVINNGLLDIPVGKGGEPNASSGSQGSIPFLIDLGIHAENDLWIRNSNVNVEIAADMKLITRKGKVLPVGDVDVIRGTYTYFGTIFDIDGGEIHFNGSDPIDPYLNVQTMHRVQGKIVDGGKNVRVINDFHLNIYGTYRDVKFGITVYDENGEVVPVDEQRAMTLLLLNLTNEEFDQRAALNQQKLIGRIERILAQQTSSLIQPISRLDVLELRTSLFSGDGEASRAQVTVGEYLMKDFFVSYSQDIIDPSINNIAAEVFLGKKSSILGQTDSRGRQYSIELHYWISY
jgi:hypothetical protein